MRERAVGPRDGAHREEGGGPAGARAPEARGDDEAEQAAGAKRVTFPLGGPPTAVAFHGRRREIPGEGLGYGDRFVHTRRHTVHPSRHDRDRHVPAWGSPHGGRVPRQTTRNPGRGTRLWRPVRSYPPSHRAPFAPRSKTRVYQSAELDGKRRLPRMALPGRRTYPLRVRKQPSRSAARDAARAGGLLPGKHSGHPLSLALLFRGFLPRGPRERPATCGGGATNGYPLVSSNPRRRAIPGNERGRARRRPALFAADRAGRRLAGLPWRPAADRPLM